MNKVISLRQKRKQIARNEKRKAADQNAALHGVPKDQLTLNKAQGLKAARALDGHKRDV